MFAGDVSRLLPHSLTHKHEDLLFGYHLRYHRFVVVSIHTALVTNQDVRSMSSVLLFWDSVCKQRAVLSG